MFGGFELDAVGVDGRRSVPGPWAQRSCFYYDFFGDECFSVTQSELLTEGDVTRHWHIVEQAGRKEDGIFVKHDVFKIDLTQNSTNIVDTV